MTSFIHVPFILTIFTYVQCIKSEVNCVKSVKIFNSEYDMKVLMHINDNLPQNVLFDEHEKILVEINGEFFQLQDKILQPLIGKSNAKKNQKKLITNAIGNYKVIEYETQEDDQLGKQYKYTVDLNITNFLDIQLSGEYLYIIDSKYENVSNGNLYVINKSNIQISGLIVEAHYVSELGDSVLQVSVSKSGDILILASRDEISGDVILMKALKDSTCKVLDQCLAMEDDERKTSLYSNIIQNTEDQLKKSLRYDPKTQKGELELKKTIDVLMKKIENVKTSSKTLLENLRKYHHDQVNLILEEFRRRRQSEDDKVFKCISEDIVVKMSEEINKSHDNIQLIFSNINDITEQFVTLDNIATC